MQYGTAESHYYSLKLESNLQLLHDYNRSQIAYILDRDPQALERKGVFNRQDSDFLILFVTLNKAKNTTQYVDGLEGSTLAWEGQNYNKFAEKAMLGLCSDIFVFIREAEGLDFTYYGKAIPDKYQLQMERELRIPSKIIFFLYEYDALINRYADSEIIRQPAPKGIYYENDIVPTSTESERFQKIRTAQTQYRNNALSLWENKCAVTGIDEPSWLIASHIKPWKESNNKERIDKFNSLLLTPDYDKLFDKGIISFNDSNGRIIFSSEAQKNSHFMLNLEKMHIDSSSHLRFIPDKTAEYLQYHQSHVLNFTQSSKTIFLSDYVI